MANKLYVDGGILINTRFFTCINAGCLYNERPEGAEVIEPTTYVEGQKCLIIDDEHPLSMFNEYYARTFFTSLYQGADYLNKSYEDCYNEFILSLNDVRSIRSITIRQDNGVEAALMKMLYVNVITILDAFICSVILSTVVRNEEIFVNYYNQMISNNVKISLEKYLIKEERGLWEQGIVKEIMLTSYSNIKTIKNAFKAMGMAKPQDPNDIISRHFHNRHLLVHRNGKMKDGRILMVNAEMIDSLLVDIEGFANQIMRIIGIEGCNRFSTSETI